MGDVAEVVEEAVEGVAEESSRVFRAEWVWGVAAVPLAEYDSVRDGVWARRVQDVDCEVHACSPEWLELLACD